LDDKRAVLYFPSEDDFCHALRSRYYLRRGYRPRLGTTAGTES
jgi:hypothetical protein